MFCIMLLFPHLDLPLFSLSLVPLMCPFIHSLRFICVRLRLFIKLFIVYYMNEFFNSDLYEYMALDMLVFFSN